MGQLENSEGHRKISRALTGFFSDKYSHVINSAAQFLMQFEFFRVLTLKVKPASKYYLVLNIETSKPCRRYSNEP